MTLKLHNPFSEAIQQEEGSVFAPKFDLTGLITAVVTDVKTNELLMVAHMNEEAVKLTLKTGIAHYWSRSRAKLWKKGEISGNLQKVVEIKTDCDQDALWLKVEVQGHGATCHTGQNSCFYRTIKVNDNGVELVNINDERLFNPSEVYKI